ncbi:MAG: efflux RND transporter permease subunit [Gammaproteobacteria bacterium]
MIAHLIRWSLANRFLVLLATLLVSAWGVWSVSRTPLDALPDLSDVQVIVRTPYPGQAPQIVENQVTYPLTTTMLSVPGAKTVRGYSLFGDSFVYVLFEGRYGPLLGALACPRISQPGSKPAATRSAALARPDATGVGWIYEYALVDRTGRLDISELRALQDWFLKYELKSVPNVAEVATLGGAVRQYQVVLDPNRLRAYGITHREVVDAIRGANSEAGGSVLELARSGIRGASDGGICATSTISARSRCVRVRAACRCDWPTSLTCKWVRNCVGASPSSTARRSHCGIIVMRSGKNALETIAAVKRKIEALKSGLPAGVEIVETYDRSSLIERSVRNLAGKLIEEFIVVALVCLAFLFHLRSALVAVVSLPIGVLMAFIVMRYQGVNANIMSLGGIAIAIGAMVDAAIVMIENAHKHLEHWRADHPDREPTRAEHWALIAEASVQVGPALFFSLLIITLSFIPIFTLQAQEGRLFAPLAFTKTYAMAAAAGLAVTLVPVLMGYFIRGKIRPEDRNPLNRMLVRAYRPMLDRVLRHPRWTIGIAVLLLAVTVIPILRLGGEFMPALDEGDILHMPSALPGLSTAKASQLLQQMDRLLMTVPEVKRVFGKMGRAETATDPAPIEMTETTVQFKPRDQWRAGMTPEKLLEELDERLKLPGIANVWIHRFATASICSQPASRHRSGSKSPGAILRSSTRWRRQSSSL